MPNLEMSRGRKQSSSHLLSGGRKERESESESVADIYYNIVLYSDIVTCYNGIVIYHDFIAIYY